MIRYKVMVGALTLLFFTEATLAASMRCGIHIIADGGRNGPGKYEVLKKCGEPRERHGNTWIYERQGRSRRVLTFDDSGMLISIRG